MPAEGTNGLAILGQTTFNSNVNLIFKMWLLLYDRNATATNFLNNNMWTSKHANSERGFDFHFEITIS